MTQSLGDLLVVSDMTNTLLAAKGGIPQVNRDVIRLFCARGGRFTVATERTVDSVRAALGGLALSGPAVCCGGSVLYDFAQEKCLEQHALDRAQAMAAVREIRRRFPKLGAEIQTDNGKVYLIRATAATHSHLQAEKLSCLLAQPADVPAPWVRVVFLGTPTEIDELQRFGDAYRAGDTMVLTRTGPGAYAVMSAGASKASGLKKLAERLGVPLENTIMIGDSSTDMACMKEAGRAVAVAGAPGRVKLAAGTVTHIGCEDGAVAEYLYGLMRQYEKNT